MLIRHPEADARMARSQGPADYWPALLRYPLTGYCLPVILLLAVLLTLATGSAMDLPGGFSVPTTGLPLFAICVIWTVVYLLRVIEHTTRGYATPPPLGSEALYLAGALKPIVVPLLVGLSLFALASRQPGLAQILLALALFVLPAYLFIFATEEDLGSALNPLRWLQLIAAFGLAYLLPGLLLAGGALLLGHIASSLGVATLLAACGYLLFGTAHLLGYLGFKRQHVLGLQVDVQHPDAVAREQAHARQLKALLHNLEEWQRDGSTQRAERAIESHGGGPLDAIRFFEELFRTLSTQHRTALLHSCGRRLINLLLAAGQAPRALDIAEGCLNHHPHFAPATPEALEALLKQAIDRHFDTLYERLLEGAEADQHLTEPRWARVQFLRALYQSEVRRDDAGALQRLAPLRAMIHHTQHSDFERTARTLEALLASKQAIRAKDRTGSSEAPSG